MWKIPWKILYNTEGKMDEKRKYKRLTIQFWRLNTQIIGTLGRK